MGVEDLTQFQSWPYESLGPARALDPLVEVEPPRHGEGGVDCPRCQHPDEGVIWQDGRWLLTLYENTPFLGVVLLQPREHVESIADLPSDLAVEFGPMVGRVHVWFYPRPYGQLQLRGTFFPIWGFTLPDRPIEETREAGRRIAAAMAASA